MALRDLTGADLEALLEVSRRLGVAPEELGALVDFETAGTWNPAVRNPGSSARGLLQFMDATARGMGYADSAALVAAHPTVADQLRGPVLAYLAPLAPFPTLQSLALAVFYPRLRYASAAEPFPEVVRVANPGIERVSDYVRRVAERVPGVAATLRELVGRHPGAVLGGGGAALALLLAGLALLLLRRPD
jgi:hypothetical protein